ncbi:hypothetical protein GmHk_07G019789 [Glycine max]|nr:hypothetical protein GmHk_07G019789 [Glycine max]
MEEMNMHKTTKGTLRVHRSHSNLKNNANRRSHKEHRTRNDVEIDHRRDSVAPRPRFLFFLLLLLSLFSQFPHLLNLRTLPHPP